MRRLAFAILLLCGLVCEAHADDAVCTLKRYASLDMTGFPDGVVVPVSIAGKTYHFLIDTGGVYSYLDQDVADALGLESHRMSEAIEIYHATGKTDKRYVNAENFGVGPIHLDNFAMILEQREPGNTLFDGVLGPDFLSKFDVELDFANGKINLFSQDHCAEMAAYWSKNFAELDFKFEDSHIVLPMTLDGHEVSAILDTGATRTSLNERVSKRDFDLDQNSPGMEHNPDATPDALEQYRYRFKSLSLSGLEVKRPLIYILPDLMHKAFWWAHTSKTDRDPVYGVDIVTPDVILGMNVLSKLRIYVSYKEKKLYVSPADAR